MSIWIKRIGLGGVFLTVWNCFVFSQSEQITYSDHIAPILEKNCIECHNPNGIGPFSLLTFEQAKKRARQIVEVTEESFMPPWKADPNYGPKLQGERRLTEGEIELISKWRAAGSLPGSGRQRIEVPEVSEEWRLGPPDLIVEVGEGYSLPSEGVDVYHNFVLDVPIQGREYVRAVEFLPVSKLVVHHALITFDRSDWSREMDKAEPGLGFSGMKIGNADNPLGYLIGWTPGQVPFESYPGAPWVLEPDQDMILRLHMLPSGKPESIRSKIGFYFTDEAPRLETSILQLSEPEIDIPAGEAEYEIEQVMKVPVDVEILGMYPHAHYIGKDMRIFAELPGGEILKLLRIPDWDFNWQSDFRFEKPVKLPSGSEIVMRYSYDNSAGNFRNPSSPPQRVTLGWNSSDEMGEVAINLLLNRPEDQAALKEAQKVYYRESMGEAVFNYEKGIDYFHLGMRKEAQFAFEAALAADPNFGDAANNLGVVYQRMGDYENSRRYYERAHSIDPSSELWVLNLFELLAAEFSAREAYEFLKTQLERQPENETLRIRLSDYVMEKQSVRAGLEVLAEGIAFDEDSLKLNYRLGILYSELKDPVKSEQYLSVVTSHSSETDEAASMKADAYFSIALMAIEGRDVAGYQKALAQTFSIQSHHLGARLFAAGGAIRQGDEAVAREHLGVLVDLPLDKQPSIEEWIRNLGFPRGQILVARLLKEKGKGGASKALLEASLNQAKQAKNSVWVEALEGEIFRRGVDERN